MFYKNVESEYLLFSQGIPSTNFYAFSLVVMHEYNHSETGNLDIAPCSLLCNLIDYWQTIIRYVNGKKSSVYFNRGRSEFLTLIKIVSAY